MQFLTILLLAVCIAYTTALGLGSTKAFGVQGCFTCFGKPAVGVKVKLYDEDKLSMDDKVAEGKTDNQGCIRLAGSRKDMFGVKPKVNIYHKCDKTIPVCYYKQSYYIPKQFLTSGTVPKQFYDVGRLELSMFKKSRDCFN